MICCQIFDNITIVDAYDAMTHDRPYSRAKSREEALAEIISAAGYQFDPNLAEIFINIASGCGTTLLKIAGP